MNNQLFNDLVKKGMSPTFAQSVTTLSSEFTDLEDLLYMWIDEHDPVAGEKTLNAIKEQYKDIVAHRK